MLTTLRIKNLALVEDLTVELQPGFNAISGETGAGKSIILGALNLVLGERADRSLIRSGAEACSVEAAFHIQTLKAPLERFLDEHGLEPCENDLLLLKRSFTASGTNKQFINGSPTTLQILARLGEWLVDIHGPHDHQSLLHPARQLQILDAFGGLEEVRGKFGELVQERLKLESQKTDLVVDEKIYAQQVDLLRFQVHEIRNAQLTPQDGEELEQEHQRATNAARLLQLAQGALEVLSDSDDSLQTQAGKIGRALQELQRLDPSAEEMVQRHQEITSQLQDLASEMSGYVDSLDLDPDRLQQLEERVNLVQNLKRKYGPTLEEVLEHGRESAEKLTQLESRDEALEKIRAQLEKNTSELEKAGGELSQKRKKVWPQLVKAVVKELEVLGFKQSLFSVGLTTKAVRDFSSSVPQSGLDVVEFLFAPNPGEPSKPLRAIASSGEMARVMLALKTVLACADSVPVLVFDEVDANVGGETARAVGEKMRQIGKQRQVLCITHLAPVAAAGDVHFLVEKEVKNGRTLSGIHLLNKKDRVQELARMLGGQGEAARKHAEELLKV